MDGDVMTTMARAVLRRYFNPYAMRGLGAGRLAAFLRSHAAGRQSRILDQTAPIVQALLAAADDAIALYGTQRHGDFALLQAEIVRELDIFDALERSVRQLDEEIATLSEQTGMASLLESIPGVADVTASVFLGYIGQVQRFKNVSSFKTYCGAIPRVVQSGVQRNTPRRSPKQGPITSSRCSSWPRILHGNAIHNSQRSAGSGSATSSPRASGGERAELRFERNLRGTSQPDPQVGLIEDGPNPSLLLKGRKRY